MFKQKYDLQNLHNTDLRLKRVKSSYQLELMHLLNILT